MKCLKLAAYLGLLSLVIRRPSSVKMTKESKLHILSIKKWELSLPGRSCRVSSFCDPWGKSMVEPSTLITRGLLSQLTSGGLTVLYKSFIRLETVNLGLFGPKNRLMLWLSPPAVGLTVLGPLLKPHPCWKPNEVWTSVTEKMVARVYLYSFT